MKKGDVITVVTPTSAKFTSLMGNVRAGVAIKATLTKENRTTFNFAAKWPAELQFGTGDAVISGKVHKVTGNVNFIR